MRRYLVLALLLISATALTIPDFALSVDVLDDYVKIGEMIRVNITIKNEGTTAEDYYLVISGKFPGWIHTYPYTDTIEPGESQSQIIIIEPREDGNFEYRATLKYDTITTNDLPILFSVEPDPSIPVPKVFNMNITNTNVVPGSDINIQIKAEGFTPKEAQVRILLDKKEAYQGLIPINKNEGIVGFKLPETMLAGTYELILSTSGQRAVAEFTIPEVRKVERSRSIDNSLFGREVILKVTNKGNVPASGDVVDTILWYETYFAKFSKHPKISENVASWNYELNPGQAVEIEYSISFLPLVLIVLIVVMIIAYFAQELDEVVVEKIARNMDGNTKVTVRINNNSKEKITKIKLVDQLPPFSKAKFGQNPQTKLKTTDGLIMSWRFDEVPAGENVEIEYHIKLPQTIGRAHLPKAKVEYELDGSERIATSISPYV